MRPETVLFLCQKYKEVVKIKIKKNTNQKTKVKFPYRIYLDNGRNVPVPSQHHFKSEFVQRHGCSLVAFYMALRFLGIKKNMSWCLKYMNSHYGLCGRSKYPIKKISAAINKIVSGAPAKYYKSPSADAIRKALKSGYMVLIEERDPIHTVVLLWDGKKTKRFSDGGYKNTTVNQEMAKRCGDAYYGGCVVVMRK